MPSLPKLNINLHSISRKLSFGRRSGADVVGLDIQPGFVGAVQASVNGSIVANRAVCLPLGADVVREGEVVDQGALSEVLRELFAGKRMSKRVRVGVANQRTVMRTLELPPVTDRKELAAAVSFQAQDQVPMPLGNAVLDFHPLGIVDTPSGPRQHVVLVAAQLDMVEHLLGAVRRAGLQPVGIDLSAFALIRSLYLPQPEAEQAGRVVYLNVDGLTNLAIAEGTVCRFTRVVGGGMEGMAGELAERLGIPVIDARGMLLAVDLRMPAAVERSAVAPEQIAPQDVAPEPSAPDPATVEDVTPEEVAPEKLAPEGVSPELVVPEEVAPQGVSPEGVAPEEVAPEGVVWEGVASKGVSPAGVAPEEVAPEKLAPEGVAPEEVAPQEVAPEGVVWEGVASKGVSPAGVTPEEVAPAKVAPEGVSPEGVAPEEVAHEGVAPEVAIADGVVAAGALPPGIDAMRDRELSREDQDALEHAMSFTELSSLPAPARAPEVSQEPPESADARRVLENGIREISGEVRNSLDFHRSQEGGADVSHVVLSGSALDVPGFAEALQGHLGLEVRPATVRMSDKSSADTISMHRLAVATGLASVEVHR